MAIIIPNSDSVTQGSEAWFALRMGIPTASEFKNFMDGEFNLKQGKKKGDLNAMVETYLCRKCAERFEGPPIDPEERAKFSSFVTEQGKLNEKLARAWLAMELETPIEEVCFVTTDDKGAGCSPDGLVGDDAGAEIKCPQGPNQARYVLNGELPDDYAFQVHGSLWITGRRRWHFVSYRDGWPALHLVIERDEAIMQRIGESVRQFNALLDAAFEKL